MKGNGFKRKPYLVWLIKFLSVAYSLQFPSHLHNTTSQENDMLDPIDFTHLKKTYMRFHQDFEYCLTLLEAEIKVKGADELLDAENMQRLLNDIWQYYSEIKQMNQELIKDKEITVI